MALMLGRLYDALRAGDVPDDKAQAAAEEVANYEGEIGKLRHEMGGLRLEMGERFREADGRFSQIEGELRLHRWMIGFVIAVMLGVFALQWQILLRLPS